MQVRKDKRAVYAFVVAAVVAVVLLAVAGYFAKSYYDLRANPSQAAEAEAQQLTATVSKLYQLPSDEEPIVGEVQDKEKLKDQPFFKNAQNGDKILIYQKAKLAIIYRQSENKLINVGPIAIDAGSQQSDGSPATQPEGTTTKPSASETTP